MGVEEETVYKAYCDYGNRYGPEGAEYCGLVFEGLFGETGHENEFQLARDMIEAGWHVEVSESGWPTRYAEVLCPDHKESK